MQPAAGVNSLLASQRLRPNDRKQTNLEFYKAEKQKALEKIDGILVALQQLSVGQIIDKKIYERTNPEINSPFARKFYAPILKEVMETAGLFPQIIELKAQLIRITQDDTALEKCIIRQTLPVIQELEEKLNKFDENLLPNLELITDQPYEFSELAQVKTTLLLIGIKLIGSSSLKEAEFIFEYYPSPKQEINIRTYQFVQSFLYKIVHPKFADTEYYKSRGLQVVDFTGDDLAMRKCIENLALPLIENLVFELDAINPNVVNRFR